MLTDGDYEDLPADVLRDIGALQAASDALNARAFYLACHDPERTNDDLERYVQVARRIEYLISDASFTSSFSASPGARSGGNGRGRKASSTSSRCSKIESGPSCSAFSSGCNASWPTTRSRRRCTRS